MIKNYFYDLWNKEKPNFERDRNLREYNKKFIFKTTFAHNLEFISS